MNIQKPTRIKGTKDYAYKGYVLGRYQNANNGIRWNVELNGKEIAYDFTRLMNAQNYIDSHLRTDLNTWIAL